MSMYNLGILYINGFGVKSDRAEARGWFEKAAAAGYAEARKELQIMDQRSGAAGQIEV